MSKLHRVPRLTGIFAIAGTFSCSTAPEYSASKRSEAVYSALPTTEELCSVTIGESHRDWVEQVLGSATVVYETADSLSMTYSFGSPLSGQQFHVTFEFDTEGIVVDPFTSGVEFPQCWRLDLAEGPTQPAEQAVLANHVPE